MPLLRNKDQQ